MPPTDPPAAPNPSDTQKMAAIVVKQEDPNHIPQWAVKALLAVMALLIIPGSIAVVSWVLGGIHSRLTENEKSIQQLREDRAHMKARLERNEDGDRRQWEVIGDHKEKIADHHHN